MFSGARWSTWRPARFKNGLVGFTGGGIGLFWLTRRVVHADSESASERTPSNPYEILLDDAASRHVPILSLNPEWTLYECTNRKSGVITGKTGVDRFDLSSTTNGLYSRGLSTVSSSVINNGTSWTFFGLFDSHHSHNSYHCASFLSAMLVPTILDALVNVVSRYEPASDQHTELGTLIHTRATDDNYSAMTNAAIKAAFEQVDTALVTQAFEYASSQQSKAVATHPVNAALSGSSALVAWYDSNARRLTTIGAGTSRAILGRRSKKSKKRHIYHALPLSIDNSSHPPSQEPSITPAVPPAFQTSPQTPNSFQRVFGMAAHKWSYEMQERIHQEYLGDPPKVNNRSLTVEPEIATTEIEPGDFLILGSDTLWASLTYEDAVGLVGHWLDKRMYQVNPMDIPSASSLPPEIINRSDLPVIAGVDNTTTYHRWQAKKQFVCIDGNSAFHLTRNALGGANTEMTTTLFNSLHSEDRTDITVTVVFFGDN